MQDQSKPAGTTTIAPSTAAQSANETPALNCLVDRWPSGLVARRDVGTFSGGLLNAKTLANRDSAGTGPRVRITIGRRVCYPVESLVEWMGEEATVTVAA
nr:hypothetical protein [uncultured Desulfuromonas sp.]